MVARCMIKTAAFPYRSLRWRQIYLPTFRRFSAQPSQDGEDVVPIFSPPIHSRPHKTRILSPNAHAHPNLSKRPKIGTLVIVRHGQSEWNVTDPTRKLTARFTGWADIGLTQQGKDQALAAGRAIQFAVEKDILRSKEESDSSGDAIPDIDVVFCSLLRRASDTMNIMLKEIHLAERIKGKEEYQYPIPVIQSWRLNERHYGALVGLSKTGAERLYGKVRLNRWRDSWSVPPPPMPLEMIKRWGKEDHCQPVTIVKKFDSGRTCVLDPTSAGKNNINDRHGSQQDRRDARRSGIKIVEHGGKKKISEPITFMPSSESLRDTYERFLPIWLQGIAPHLRAGRTVLVVGHANTIRSMIYAIDGDIVTKESAKKVKIPSALPLIYEFVDCEGSGFLEVVGEDTREHISSDGIADQKSQSTSPLYRLDGRDCSSIVPGNLRVLKPPIDDTAEKHKKKDFRYQLSGTWVETDETKSASFCTELGRMMGEQDIA